MGDDTRRALIFSLVEKEEHKEQRNEPQKICPQTAFQQADTNGDGVLNQEEFSRWIQSRSWFGPLDNKSQYSKSKESATHPSKKQLMALAMQVGIPFVGFGFLDNAIMITAGNTIEQSIGITLGLSTLAAAGLGNLLSDVAGIGLGNTIEMTSHKLGLPKPNLTTVQERSGRVRWVRLAASIIGIAVGCILGMFPLLLMSTPEEALFRRIFDQMDTNDDGVIDYKELEAAFTYLGMDIHPDLLRSFFEFIDLNNDGVINFEEFSYLASHLKSMIGPQSKGIARFAQYFKTD